MSDEPELPLEFSRRAPRYWIRRYLAERDAFVLAPVDGENAEFLAAIDPQSPTRGRMRDAIMAALFEPRRSFAPVRLLVRDRTRRPTNGSDEPRVFTITDFFASPPSPRREAHWSDALEEAVDHHHRLWLAQRAIDFFANIDAAAFARIREQARRELPVAGHNMLPEELLTGLAGQEETHQRRYNPSLPLRLQLSAAPRPHQLANYAFQRAVVAEFAARMNEGKSALAEAYSALRESGALVALPAMRNPTPLHEQTAEAARGIGAQVLAGLMELNGAEAATQECDELWAPKADGSFARRRSLHDEVLREMAPHPIANSVDPAEKTRAYLALARDRLDRYAVEARELIAAEHTKAGPAKSRSLASNADLTAMPASTGRRPTAKGWAKIGEAAAGAVDHAHKLAAESEAVPWF